MTPAIKYTLIKDGKSNAPQSKACNFRYDLYFQILLFCAFMSILLLYKHPRSDFQYDLIAGNSSKFLVHRQEALSNDDYDDVDMDDGVQYKNSTLSKNKYFVHTKECVIPYVDPVTSGAAVIYKPKTPINCSDGDAFVDSIYDVNSKQYILHINYKVAEGKLLNSSDELSCCYREILRAGRGAAADKKTNILPCIVFHQDFYVPEHINGVIVECTSVLNQTLLQKDGFSFVQYKNVTTNPTGRSDIRKPSVLMIGIDSVSRINLRRVMPRTAEYLIDNNWFELQGYNKVGDNTFPNLMALLVGYDKDSAYKICKPKSTGGLDKCDFVWKLFKNNGYRTAYAEDTTGIGTFTYLKKGFRDPPTDYYMRPFFMALQGTMKARWVSGSKYYCIGRRRYAEYIYDHALQFGQRYNDEPFFGLFWTNSFSHNYYHTPAHMDERMRTYLTDLEETDILDTSIVIFLSDHGMRWGKLFGLKSGFLENRLPMLFIWLPLWFRNEYPEYVKALETNRNRLTSPFDLHMTLKHIVKIGNPELEVSPAQGCVKCQTVFEEIPENRTCNDAGITPYWCTCNPFKKLKKNDPTIQNVTKLIINEMNEYLYERKMSSLCREITLETVIWAGRELILHPSLDNPALVRYKIEFMISENNATFEARPEYIVGNQTVNIDVEQIGRTNKYEGDSQCVSDDMAKKYCICKV